MSETSAIQFESTQSCWCRWSSKTQSAFSEDYWKCERCGAHYAKQRLASDSIAAFYSYDLYWHDRQARKEHPVLEERPEALQASGRVDKWLDTIRRHLGTQTGLAVEVGCAEGILLQALSKDGWETLGIEPDEKTARHVSKATGLDIRTGVFPEASAPQCDLFIANDVLEHVAYPQDFVAKAAESLREGGVMLLQLPILENEEGFGEMSVRVFDWEEHAHIFTRTSIAALLQGQGLEILENHDAWSLAHEIVVARKPKEPSMAKPKLLANLADTFSPAYLDFTSTLNAFAADLGLRQFCNWSKIWEYPRIWRGGLDKLDWKNAHLVDIGSEQSPWPWYAASRGARVTIVEAEANWIEQWTAIREKLNVNVDWLISDSSALPLETESVDALTSFSVLEHQDDKLRAFQEAARALKPGGLLGLSFDVMEDGYGMSYPEWGGTPWSINAWSKALQCVPELEPEPDLLLNRQDIDSFLHWHRATAPHHNYVTAATVLRKR